MNNIIIGVDPGYTTGISVFEDPLQEINPEKNYSDYLVYAGTITGYEGYKEFLIKYSPKIVIIEDYKLYPKVNKSWDSMKEVRILGVIEYITQELNIPFIEQPPSKKWFWDNNRLKKMGLKQKVIHSNDSIRHVLEFLSKKWREI